MKVVLFCGGLGMRLRDSPHHVPKPMVPIGGRPILWHLMKYYAHHGLREFILCLGYRGEVIRNYVRDLQEDWTVHCVDSGITATIGERLLGAEPLLRDEEVFCANYADGLSDLPFGDHLEHFRRHGRVASFVSVRPNLSYHTVAADSDGRVTSLDAIGDADVRVNGGFFLFRQEIFRYLCPGEELVEAPFRRLMSCGQLGAYEYNGFWAAIDTAKDKLRVDDLYATGSAPWMVWDSPVHVNGNGNGSR